MKLRKYLTVAALAIFGTLATISFADAGSCRGGGGFYGRGGFGPSYGGYRVGCAPYCPPAPAYQPYVPCYRPYYGPPPVSVTGHVIQPVVATPAVPVTPLAAPAAVVPQAGVVATPTGAAAVPAIVEQGVAAPVQPAVAAPAGAVTTPAVPVAPVATPTGTPLVPPDAPLPKIERTAATGPGPVGPLTAYNVGIGSQVAPEIVTRQVIDAPSLRLPIVDR